MKDHKNCSKCVLLSDRLKLKTQKDRWNTHTVEGQPILQTVPTTEVVKVQGGGGLKLYESSSGYLWSSTVYTGKKTILESPLILKKHTKNSGTSSESFWTHTPQWQLTCGWINIIILQAWPGLKSCNTNYMVMVKINRKVTPKKPWESKFQTDKVTLKMNLCVLRWHNIKT